MALSITRDEKKERDEYLDALTTAHAAMIEAIKAYNGSIEDLRTWAAELHGRLDDEYYDRTDRWQESDAGELAREWIDSIYDLDAPDEVDEPDELDLSDWYEMPTKPGAA